MARKPTRNFVIQLYTRVKLSLLEKKKQVLFCLFVCLKDSGQHLRTSAYRFLVPPNKNLRIICQGKWSKSSLGRLNNGCRNTLYSQRHLSQFEIDTHIESVCRLLHF